MTTSTAINSIYNYSYKSLRVLGVQHTSIGEWRSPHVATHINIIILLLCFSQFSNNDCSSQRGHLSDTKQILDNTKSNDQMTSDG